MDSLKEGEKRSKDMGKRPERQRRASVRASTKSQYSPAQCVRHMEKVKTSLDRSSSIEQMQAYLAGLQDEEKSKMDSLMKKTKKMFRDCNKEVKAELKDCVVCLDKIKSDDQVSYNPLCLHFLHKQCMAEWLTYSRTCPYCRQVVTSPQEVEAGNALMAETFAKFVTKEY